jgi:hypothetical protein
MNLGLIYVDYKKDQDLSVFNKIYHYAKNLKSNLIVCFINNLSNEKLKQSFQDTDVKYFEGNNIQDEFSAWDIGIEKVKILNFQCDYYLFANSAYFFYHSLNDYNPIKISYELNGCDFMGLSHSFHPSMYVEFINKEIHSWINTSVFFLSNKSVKYLNYKLTKFNISSYNEDEKFDQLINNIGNKAFFIHIDNWIRKNEKYNGRYKIKFLNILNEINLHNELMQNKEIKIKYFNNIF